MNQLLILADGKGRIKAFSLSKRQEKEQSILGLHMLISVIPFSFETYLKTIYRRD